jgi:hypothetical protein
MEKGFRVHPRLVVGLSPDLQNITLRIDDEDDIVLPDREARLLAHCITSILSYRTTVAELERLSRNARPRA